MSVQTTADDRRDEAVNHVKEAIRCLSDIVVDQCHGHDDWTPEYQGNLKRSLLELIEIRDRL
jgi:hypothetical protein